MVICRVILETPYKILKNCRINVYSVFFVSIQQTTANYPKTNCYKGCPISNRSSTFNYESTTDTLQNILLRETRSNMVDYQWIINYKGLHLPLKTTTYKVHCTESNLFKTREISDVN